MNVPSLIDLSGVVAIVASSGAVAAILQWLRDIGLDRLTQAMPDTQRNALLRALLIVLNFGAILGLALVMGNPMSGALLLSAGLTAFIGAAGSHVLYSYVQKPAPTVSAASVATLLQPAPMVQPAPVAPSALHVQSATAPQVVTVPTVTFNPPFPMTSASIGSPVTVSTDLSAASPDANAPIVTPDDAVA